MTREEILKLEAGPELDRLVAEKVIGWEEGKDFDCSGEGTLIHYPFRNRVLSKKWSPSTDIAAAWEVVRRVFELKPTLGFVLFTDISGHCRAAFYDILEYIDQVVPVSEIDDAETVPLAICRAALLAVEATQEKER